MRAVCICLVMGAMSLILEGTATAQAPPPRVDYNYLRAYQHFAGSRSGYRVLYSSVPGSGRVTMTPYFYQSQYIEPAYSRQRITPYGYDRLNVHPAAGGMTMTPFGYSTYYVPGFSSVYYLPRPR